MSNVRLLCHCGDVARNDGSDYEGVCSQWPLCETREGPTHVHAPFPSVTPDHA